MTEKKQKPNIFQRIGHRFVEIRQEFKRVIWPTRQKLLQIAVVVLAVILASAILLTLAGQGAQALLTKAGFYKQIDPTTTTTTVAATTEATETSGADATDTTTSGDETAAADATTDTSAQ